ncbi:ankyrin repeat domain-containing protein [Streptomyces sp. RS10V-4]|uniref:ankyrin repeat domain-containing protein n=1 Tax=Streptomyces rhizoryzae TaxID=2932493 RepID=UPI002003C369|nr:ankyrin repeat domain-containing protein [Streptomyces rhizoryzae]MCK7627081.1 ankyrin repeat domain-containing protein [Streptomyces rhizoryzae]
MSFFDGLTPAGPPPEVPDEILELGPYAPAGDEEFAPSQWFVPAQLPQLAEAGAGPAARIVLTGWDVWPRSVTMRLSVFLRRIRPGGRTSPYGRPGGGGLRCGLLLADGRKVTTLDGGSWPASGQSGPVLRLSGGTGGAFHHQLELHLSQMPPAGPTQLVVEWPDEQVPDTVTVFDAGPLRAVVREVREVWPETAPPGTAPPAGTAADGPLAAGPSADGEARGFLVAGLGPAEILARPPAVWSPPVPEPAVWTPPAPDPARAGWEGMADAHWRDTALVLERLAHGADPAARAPGSPEAPLHAAAAHGSPEAVAALLAAGAAADAPDHQGCTPLWHAVCHGARENAALLLRAGADAWRPQLGGRSPGRLALTTPLAPLFAGLPGAVPLTPAERAAQREADERAAVFAGVPTESLSAAFVAGVGEEEAVRRLGRDPRDCPVLPPDAAAEPWEGDAFAHEEAHRQVGVTGVPGGCVLVQPYSYLLSTEPLLDALSPGGAAYGVYFNPKGGTFGTLSRDGRTERTEEIGLPPYGDEPEGHWLYRFWSWDRPEEMYGASELAYACAQAGLRLADPQPLSGAPRRWVLIPDGSPLL